MRFVFASLFSWNLPGYVHWSLLFAQGLAYVAAVAIILRLSQEKRTPSNILSWSLGLVFMPLVCVPLYLLVGGRKIRRLVAEKHRMKLENGVDLQQGVALPGNSVRLLGDGVEAYRTFCKEIDHARETIDIATFILGGDAVGRSIVRRLTRKAQRACGCVC
jgi:cardiolipin synthase A/B